MQGNNRKTIGISIACYNEEENVVELTEELQQLFLRELPNYDCRIQFIDNYSTDNTRPLLRELCAKYENVRAIFNYKNYGPDSSGYYGFTSCYEDAVIPLACDFQAPIELIPQFVKAWEEGYKVIYAKSSKGKENGLMWGIRSLYYKIMKMASDIPQIEHFTGYGLYDKSFMDMCRKMGDQIPSLRSQVAEMGYLVKELEFVRPERRHGKSKNNTKYLFSLALQNIADSGQALPRLVAYGGVFISMISMVVGLIYLVLKLIYWDMFTAGIAPLVVGVFFLGGIQIFLLGLLGQYMMQINTRLTKKPLVMEQERIGFPEDIPMKSNANNIYSRYLPD